ncbi:hypothetical protein [Singulisphaera sp. PoT]|uniref:hypothetical protein n=1 Tax=Singulisphaera sp. PoT TaxID=3411797 RepID=UPI003BF52A90
MIVADLVVVASGRHSRLPEWLTELGFAAPRETVVNSFQGYASRIYQPPKERCVGWKFLYIQQAPPDEPRGGLVSVIEDGRWLVSLIGGDGDRPPTGESGFLAFARSLRSPAIYEAIRDAEPLSPIFGHRGTENRLRHYDRLWRFPEGLVALGDATCSFNPVYGQGMTCALIGVEVLDRWLREGALHLNSASTSEFQRSLARATKPAWSFATGADYGFRTVEAPRQARSARLIGCYLRLVMGASTRRPWLRVRWAEVLHMLRPPLALVSPRVVATLIWDWLATRKAEGARSRAPGASGEPSAVFGGRRDALRSA